MYAPKELHFLASSAGLNDETVHQFWQEARQAALELLGTDDHPRYDHETHAHMLWLIETKLSQEIPANLLPWVKFDLHVADIVIEARHAARTVGDYIKEHLPGNRAA